MSLLRIASRSGSAAASKSFFRANRPVAPTRSSASFVPGFVAGSSLNFSTTAPRKAAAHHEETFEEFTAR